MSSAIEKIYACDPVNSVRKTTDTFFINDLGENDYSGLLHDAAKFTMDSQLLDSDTWQIFVQQFRLKSDSKDRGWRGEYWGKMMRGAAFTYSFLRDEELYRILTESVLDILTTEDELGRISTYDIGNEKGFSEFDGWDMWSRKYVLLGMQYYLEICRDEELKKRIIASMCRQTDYIISKIGPSEEGKLPITLATRNWRGLNSTSILEPVVRLYSLTGEKKYLDFAEYIVSEGGTSIFNLFEMALEDTTDPYQYPVTKAYEMMSCFEGLLEYYRVTGIEKYKIAVLNFARRVMNSDVSIIGCCGTTSERFDHSSVRQTDSTYQGEMQETCVTVTWMKLCLQLLALTGDVAFAECFETSLYNAYLGSLNTENRLNENILLQCPDVTVSKIMPFDSYSTLLGGIRGFEIGGFRMLEGGRYYGCCTCIGAVGIGMVPKAANMLSREGIVLNLYIAGRSETMTPMGKKLVLDCDTEYPAKGRVKFTLDLQESEIFEIKLRIPAWSEKTRLTVCGAEVDAKCGYVSLKREWKKSDTIELELDMRARLVRPAHLEKDLIITEVVWGQDYIVPRIAIPSSDAEYRLAVKYGPIVLARDARLGEDVSEKADILHDENDIVSLEESHVAKFDKVVEFKAKTDDGRKITLIDFSSAGKTWGEDSRYVCWLPTKKKYSR